MVLHALLWFSGPENPPVLHAASTASSGRPRTRTTSSGVRHVFFSVAMHPPPVFSPAPAFSPCFRELLISSVQAPYLLRARPKIHSGSLSAEPRPTLTPRYCLPTASGACTCSAAPDS